MHWIGRHDYWLDLKWLYLLKSRLRALHLIGEFRFCYVWKSKVWTKVCFGKYSSVIFVSWIFRQNIIWTQQTGSNPLESVDGASIICQQIFTGRGLVITHLCAVDWDVSWCMSYSLPLAINPNWHEAGHFPPPCPLWIRFCQLNTYQKCLNLFWRWKMTSIGLIWHPAKLIESYIKCP